MDQEYWPINITWHFGTCILYDGTIDYYRNIDGNFTKTKTIHPDGTVTMYDTATDIET